jgi:hypothetical protein
LEEVRKMAQGRILRGKEAGLRGIVFRCDFCFRRFYTGEGGYWPLGFDDNPLPISRPNVLEFPDGYVEWIFCERCIARFVRDDFDGDPDPGPLENVLRMWRGEPDICGSP